MHVPQCVLPGFPEALVVQATGNRHPGSNFRPSSDMVLPGGCQWAAVIRRAAARGEEENQTKKNNSFESCVVAHTCIKRELTMSCKNPKSLSVKPSDTSVAASVPKEDADMSACKRGPSKRKWMRGCVFSTD